MISHDPWIGSAYEQGRNGRKLLLAGYSHHGEPDCADFTDGVVRRWVEGDEDHPFATRIRSYFGADDPGLFWNSIAFINTLPASVGSSESARYSDGTQEQRDHAAPRLLAIMAALKPDQVLVFTRKGFRNLWPTWSGSVRSNYLEIVGADEVEYGPYTWEGGKSWAYGLPHPQYANTEAMKASVTAILAHRP